jgi:hypothetical protein
VPALACLAAVALPSLTLVPSATAEAARHPRLIAERLPRVVHRGGPFLRRPEITTVTFVGDDPQTVARLERFGGRIGRTAWWREVTEGYCRANDDCIRAGRAGRAIRLARRLPPRVRDVEVERWIADEARAGALAELGADALVLVYLPRGVALSDAFHDAYCAPGPRAYHRMMRTTGASFPYAVIPRCRDEAETTATASHEILEAATNPDPGRPGFGLEGGAATVAFRLRGAEPVDPCGLLTMDSHRAHAAGFLVQRAWSNAAAARGADPCVPAPSGRPYVALVPRQAVVRLAEPGTSASIVLDAVADGVVPAWRVSTRNLSADDDAEPFLDIGIDRTEVRRGEQVTLTVRRLGVPARPMAVIGLVSHQGGRRSLWPLAVSLR